MAIQEENLERKMTGTALPTIYRWPTRRRVSLRRRRLPTARLGASKPRRGLVLVRLLRKMKLRLQYTCMLKKLKEYYKKLVKDVIEGAASFEAFQQRFFMEASFAIPVGLSFSAFPSLVGPNCTRSITM